MPIAPQYRHLYKSQEWQDKRSAALERSAGKCNRCRVPNNTIVERGKSDKRVWWRMPNTKSIWWINEQGTSELPPEPIQKIWNVFIRLTTAHLDHNPENMDDANLETLCCRCHIMHDRTPHTAAARRTRQTRKDESRPLLQGLTI